MIKIKQLYIINGMLYVVREISLYDNLDHYSDWTEDANKLCMPALYVGIQQICNNNYI